MSPGIRSPGLDLLRAGAIFAVLISHLDIVWLVRPETTPIFTALGFIGVNAFFALSGYLVGGIAIRTIHGPGSILQFYARRWLRTIPVAFFVLLVLSPVLSSKDIILHATFTRFLGGAADVATLPHFWSLAVEEWAYLLLPLLILARPGDSMACKVLGAWALLAALQQVVFSMNAPAPGVMPDLLYVTWLRLDAILAGVAVYCWHDRLPRRVWRILAVLSVPAIVLSVLVLPDTIAFGTLMSALFALVLPTLHAWRPGQTSGRSWRLVQYVARISYPLYCVHLPVYFASRILADKAAAVLLAVTVSLILAHLIHVVIEQPCMQLRDRFFPAKASA